MHDSGLLAVGNARKLPTPGARPLSRCRAALSASPLAPCSPPSGLLPRRAAPGAGCRPDVAPGPPPSPPGCPAGRNPGGAPGSARICTGNRACASRGRPGRSTAPSSRSLPPARGGAHTTGPPSLGRSRGGWTPTMPRGAGVRFPLLGDRAVDPHAA